MWPKNLLLTTEMQFFKKYRYSMPMKILLSWYHSDFFSVVHPTWNLYSYKILIKKVIVDWKTLKKRKRITRKNQEMWRKKGSVYLLTHCPPTPTMLIRTRKIIQYIRKFWKWTEFGSMSVEGTFPEGQLTIRTFCETWVKISIWFSITYCWTYNNRGKNKCNFYATYYKLLDGPNLRQWQKKHIYFLPI